MPDSRSFSTEFEVNSEENKRFGNQHAGDSGILMESQHWFQVPVIT